MQHIAWPLKSLPWPLKSLPTVPHGFHYPFTLAFWHMLVAALTARAALWSLKLPDAIAQQRSVPLYTQVALTGFLFGGTLVMGNAALLYIPVTTSQMLKVRS